MQKKLIGALLLTAGLPLSALAVSLGDVELFSALNQPLNAEIEIKSISQGDVENLIARLASEKDFVQQSIPRPYWLNDLQFTPLTKSNGRSYIRVTSKKAIREPFVNFLVDMEWPKGRLVREYTLLLDPPAFLSEKPVAAPAAAPVTAQLNKTSGLGQIERDLPIPDIDLSMDADLLAAPAPVAEEQPAEKPAATQTKPSKAAAVTPVQEDKPEVQTYLVERGDTMSAIAKRFQNDKVSLNQVLMAIVKNNQRAFIHGNVNLVKAGATLKIPAMSLMTAQSRKQASKWLQQQNIAWRQGAATAVAGTGDAPASTEQATTDTAATDGKPIPEYIPDLPSVDHSQLSIVSPDIGNKSPSEHIGSADSKASKLEQLQHNLTMANERVAAADLRAQEVESRILELENIAAQSKAVLDLKNQKLSQLQANAQQPAAPAPVAEPQPEPTPEPVAQPKPAPAAPAAPAPVVNPNRPSGILGTIYDLVPAPIRNIVEPYFGGGSLYAILVIVLLIILLPVLLLFKRRQKDEPLRPIKHENWQTGDLDDRELAAPKTSLMNKIKAKLAKKPKAKAATATDLLADLDFSETDSVEPEAAIPVADEVDADQLEDDAMALALDEDEEDNSTAESPDEIDEVVTEADVYIAYGLNDKAEELLQNAIQEKPHKAIYYVKLMETYKETDSKQQFIATAEKLRTMLAGNPSSSWDKAAQLGAAYAPENDLFGGKAHPEDKAIVTEDAGADMLADELHADLNDIGLELEASLSSDSNDEFVEDVSGLDDLPDDHSNAIEPKTEQTLLDSEQIQNILTGAFDESFFEDDAPSAAKAVTSADLGDDVTETDDSADFGHTPKSTFNVDDADSLADVLSIDNEISMGDLEDITSADIELDDIAVDEHAFDLTDLEQSASQNDLAVDLQELSTDTDMVEEGETELTQLIDDESLETMIDDIGTNVAEFNIDENAPDNLDEIGTKLDLARAYIDMADYEGAKASLHEVASEGNAEQQQEAQRLLADIKGLE